MSKSDEFIPYPSFAVEASHIATLGALGYLQGLDTAPPDGCAVIDLGCASGGNLLPMAMAHPKSEFVGVDLDGREIEGAQAGLTRSRELGHDVSNLSFRQGSLLDECAQGRTYDYVICHGLYCWVPAEVREQMLRTIRQLLSPGGVAYVSFNTTPGWHRRAAIRELVHRRVQKVQGQRARAEAAQEYLKFLLAAATHTDEGYQTALKNELKGIVEQGLGYALQDLLSPLNGGYSVTSFVEHAAASGLRYLRDAQPKADPENLPTKVRQMVRNLPLVEREQLYDDIVNRSFRSAMLCRDDEAPSAAPQAGRMLDLHVATPSTLHLTGNEGDKAIFQHLGHKGNYTISDALSRRVLELLIARSPATLTVRELCSELAAERGEDAAATQAELLPRLLRFHYTGLLLARRSELGRSVVDDSAMGHSALEAREDAPPRALPWLEVEHELTGSVTTAWHGTRRIDAAQFELLALADGRRRPAEVAKLWAETDGRSPEEAETLLRFFQKAALLN